MSAFVLTGATIWLNQYDLSSDTNMIEETWEAADVDATTFGSGGNKERKAGIATAGATFSTFYNTATGRVEPVLSTLKGTAGSILTVTPDGTANQTAYFGRGLAGNIKMPMKVGDMARLDGEVRTSSTEGLVRGNLLVPSTTVSATGTTTIRQNGAVASGYALYAALHVFSGSGSTPTLDVVLQSASAAGFGTPHDQLTFAQATGATSEFKSLAGANTDTYWRASYTVGGSGPSFTFALVMGIQPVTT